MESKSPTQRHEPALQLPTVIRTPSDIGHLLRELEMLNESLLQLAVRQPGSPVTLPEVTANLQNLSDLNKLNLLNAHDRQKLSAFLSELKEKAPIVHISFSSEPAPSFLEKLISLLRRDINPKVLMTVGLQPSIGAGCVVRTTNMHFDLSLRQTFVEKRSLLLEQIIPPAPEASPS